jgi:hypothetical protein
VESRERARTGIWGYMGMACVCGVYMGCVWGVYGVYGVCGVWGAVRSCCVGCIAAREEVSRGCVGLKPGTFSAFEVGSDGGNIEALLNASYLCSYASATASPCTWYVS